MNHYVYEITNLINGMKYIGKRSCKCNIEDDRYMGSSFIVKNAIKKYGIEKFKKEIVFICETEEEAYKKEEYYITLKDAVTSKSYYNLNGGGKGCGSGENNPRYGKTSSDYQRMRASQVHKGRVKSEKERCNISKSKMGENNPMYGKTFTEEHKRKLGDSRKGEKHWNYGNSMSEENRKRLSDLWKGKRTGGDNPFSKKVVCINTGEIFNSVAEAGRKYNVIGGNISKCCKGKRKSAGSINGEKLKWIHYEEYLKNL